MSRCASRSDVVEYLLVAHRMGRVDTHPNAVEHVGVAHGMPGVFDVILGEAEACAAASNGLRLPRRPCSPYGPGRRHVPLSAHGGSRPCVSPCFAWRHHLRRRRRATQASVSFASEAGASEAGPVRPQRDTESDGSELPRQRTPTLDERGCRGPVALPAHAPAPVPIGSRCRAAAHSTAHVTMSHHGQAMVGMRHSMA